MAKSPSIADGGLPSVTVLVNGVDVFGKYDILAVEVSSPKDIQIEATGKISVTSKAADISVTGTQGVSVRGARG